MFSEDEIIYLYERLMLGKSKRSGFYMNITDASQRFGIAATITRYVVRDMLRITPREAAEGLPRDVVRMTRLDTVFAGASLDINTDLKRVLMAAFPGEYYYDAKTEALDLFKKVNGYGRYSSMTLMERPKLPRGFFTGSDGVTAIEACFSYLVTEFLSDMTMKGLYSFFSDEAASRKWMKDHGMGTAIKGIGGTMLDFLYLYGPHGCKDTYLYYEYKLKDYDRKAP